MGLGWLRDRLGDVAEATWEAASRSPTPRSTPSGPSPRMPATSSALSARSLTQRPWAWGSAVLDVVDGIVLDGVDEITGGVINVDYDDGDISASVGVDGVRHVGAAIGDDGISHSASVIDQSFDIRATDDGLQRPVQAGIDWGRCPTPQAI